MWRAALSAGEGGGLLHPGLVPGMSRACCEPECGQHSPSRAMKEQEASWALGIGASLWTGLHGEVWPFSDGGMENFALHHCGHCPQASSSRSGLRKRA